MTRRERTALLAAVAVAVGADDVAGTAGRDVPASRHEGARLSLPIFAII